MIIVIAARAKMSPSRAQNMFMPANINSIVLLKPEQINSELQTLSKNLNTAKSTCFSADKVKSVIKTHKQLTQTINVKTQIAFSSFFFEIKTLLPLQTFGKASYLTGTHLMF